MPSNERDVKTFKNKVGFKIRGILNSLGIYKFIRPTDRIKFLSKMVPIIVLWK